MKAVAVIPGARDSLHVRADVPDPRPGDGEALVRMLEAGFCGTDIEIHHGLFGQAPPGSEFLILGHENLGVVESSPPGSGLQRGELVVSTVRRPCPEACPPCRAGQNDKCLTGHYSERGILGLHGFMSESYTESPRYLVPVGATLRGVAVLMEPMSIVEKGIDEAWRIQERLAWTPRRAAVLGAGPIGMLAALALRLRGLEVTAAAREAAGSFKDRHLAQAGVQYVSTADTPLERLAERLGPVDVMLEATGAAEVVFPAIGLLGRNGVGILASATFGAQRQEIDVAAWNQHLMLGNRLVFGTVNAARPHFEAAARDLQETERRLPGWLAHLITRRVPFTEAPRALVHTPADVKTVLEFPG